MTEPILVPVSPGELLDKVTILEIKLARMADPAQIANVRREFDLLSALARPLALGPDGAEIARLEDELREANMAIWDCENTVRALARESRFGEPFVDAARRIHATNDHRAALKRRVNELLHSQLFEEKSHT